MIESETRLRVLELIDAGISYRKIAEEVGISIGSVANIRKDASHITVTVPRVNVQDLQDRLEVSLKASSLALARLMEDLDSGRNPAGAAQAYSRLSDDVSKLEMQLELGELARAVLEDDTPRREAVEALLLAQGRQGKISAIKSLGKMWGVDEPVTHDRTVEIRFDE